MRVTVELTGPDTYDSPDMQRDQMVAASYLLDNIAQRVGNGEKAATLVNKAFGVEATFIVHDDKA